MAKHTIKLESGKTLKHWLQDWFMIIEVRSAFSDILHNPKRLSHFVHYEIFIFYEYRYIVS